MLNVVLCGIPCADKTSLLSALGTALNARGWRSAVAVIDAATAPLKRHDFTLTLLPGLTATKQHRQDADQAIRDSLARGNVPYSVLYGVIAEQVEQAISLIAARLGADVGPAVIEEHPDAALCEKKNAWVWACDKCSDPECEHKLLTGLLEGRTSNLPPASSALTAPLR